MTSRAGLSGIVRILFERDAPVLARAWRCSWCLASCSFRRPDPVPWLARPCKLGITTGKQAVQEHFTSKTADFLLALLRQGVEYLVCA